MKHTTTITVKIGKGEADILIADDLISMDAITDATVDEVKQLAKLIEHSMGNMVRPMVEKEKRTRNVTNRNPQVSKDRTIRWNQKYRSDPASLFEEGSLAQKVCKAVYPMTQNPIKRGELETEVAKKIRVPAVKVNYTVSHFIHSQKLLIVVD